MKKYLFGLMLCAATAMAGAQTLSEVWRVDWKTRDWFGGTTDTVRSADYNPATGNLTVVSRDTAVYGVNSFIEIDPATGADLSTRSLEANIGLFHVNKHAHADDGVAYIANLTLATSTTQFVIHRLTTFNDSLTTAFEGFSPAFGFAANTGFRIGDTLDVVGSGLDTEIWAGTRAAAGPHLIKFTTTDGLNFTPTLQLTIPGTFSDSPSYRGMSVRGTGANAVIWVNEANMPARCIDPTTGAILEEITTTELPPVNATLALGQFEAFGQWILGINSGSIPASAANRPGYLIKQATNSLIASTVSLQASGNFPNGNGTGSVTFDPAANNVIFLATNNTLSAHAVTAEVNAAQNWDLLE